MAGSGTGRGVAVAGWALLAAVSVGPLLAEPRPVDFVPPSAGATRVTRDALVVLLLAVPIALRLRADRRSDPELGGADARLLLLAGLMTAAHWYWVDTRRREEPVLEDGRPQLRTVAYVQEWQRYLYRSVFNGNTKPGSAAVVPHVYRPLPYGFTRALERVSGDWTFACLAYRWFFNFWFVWAFYQIARRFHEPGRATLAVAVLVPLYPMSIWYYWGQLTDPMSHALFALGLLYIVEDRFPALAAAVVLGVAAKETAVLLVPAYLACYGRRGLHVWLRAAVLTLGATATFLATRLPLGWRPGGGLLHAMPGLMIAWNLGQSGPEAARGASAYQLWLQPLLFLGVFVIAAVVRWRQTDLRLQALVLTLTPLIFLTSLCFSWLYESRNYVALLPVLATVAVGPTRRPDEVAGMRPP